jgi:hypothetical protein
VLGNATLNGTSVTANQGATFGASTANQLNITGNAMSITTDGPITLNSSINDATNLTLDAAGSAGNITFNGAIGNITPLISLTIIGANNVTNNAVINTGVFTQSAGTGTTNFGSPGVTASGAASVITNQAIGTINAGSLTVGVNSGNLQGTVNGASGAAAASQVVILNGYTPTSLSFNGVPLAGGTPTPTPTPTPNVPSLIDDLLNSTDVGSTIFANLYITNGSSQSPGQFGVNTVLVYGNAEDLLQSSSDSKNGSGCVSLGNNIQMCSHAVLAAPPAPAPAPKPSH